VSKGMARFRMQVMAKHTKQNVADAATRLNAAYNLAQIEQATRTELPLSAVA